MVFHLALAVVCLLAGGATVRGYEMVWRTGWLGGGPSGSTPTEKPAAAARPKRRAAPAVALAPPATPPASPPATVSDLPAVVSKGEQALESQRASPAESVNREALRPSRSAIASIRPGGDLVRSAPEGRPPVLEPPAPVVPPSALPPSVPPLAARAPAQPPLISEEVREIDRAIGYLRRDHDAVAALAALDSYLGRYPQGALLKEARTARIDALLLLGRTDQALSALEVATFDPGLRATELLVVRAELRAARDCQRAEQDFTTALRRGPDARLLERILYGRGACRAKLLDTAGANDDLRRYLERFPTGAHADWSRRWMASRRASPEIER
jgi:tetratricopeptide (TPR) repeat protein